RPSLTGSWAAVNTRGMVLVSALAANAGVEPPIATITATWRRTNSAASVDNRSILLSAQRYSIATFSPSTTPTSSRPWRQARERSVSGCERDFASCSLQAAAAPSSVALDAMLAHHRAPQPHLLRQKRRLLLRAAEPHGDLQVVRQLLSNGGLTQRFRQRGAEA